MSTGATSTPHAADSTCTVGTKVTVLNKDLAGTVQFIGKTKFAEGVWVGVELDKAVGKNDGSVNGVQYFKCGAERGVFLRPANVKPIVEAATSTAGASAVNDESAAPRAVREPKTPASLPKPSTANGKRPHDVNLKACASSAEVASVPKLPAVEENREKEEEENEEEEKKKKNDQEEEEHLDCDHYPQNWQRRRRTRQETMRGSILVPSEPDTEMPNAVQEAALEVAKLREMVSRLSGVLDHAIERAKQSREKQNRNQNGVLEGIPPALMAASDVWLQQASKRLETRLSGHLQQTLAGALAGALAGPLAQARLAEAEVKAMNSNIGHYDNLEPDGSSKSTSSTGV